MTRLYRLLLRLYPRPFRARYGGELLEALRAERAAPCHAGLAGHVRFWIFIIRDLTATACRQRLRQAASTLPAFGGGVPRLPRQEQRTEMDTVLLDVRYAIRQFVRRPAFTAVAVGSLALAIGGNTLIYGMLDGFVFHPFPYPEPDRLVSVGVTFPRLSSRTTYIEALSPAEYGDLRASRAFSHIAAFDLGNRNISGGDVPERVFTALLLDDLFPVIGMAPALGRGFTREELGPNGPPAAIISHRLWRSRFGGDPAILNRSIRIGGRAASVVGVMPPGLILIGTDLWIPWGGTTAAVPRNARQFNVIGRLGAGSSLATANAELSSIARRVEQAEKRTFAEYQDWQLTATPWAAALMQDLRPAAFVLLGAAAVVLLIACANLANLFLARSTTRQRELAVRLALGAARWRLARHLLTESLLLALGGSAVGIALTYVGLQAAGALIPSQFQMLDLGAGLTSRVIWWSIGLALASGLLVGLAPALQATRTDPHDSLRSDGRTGAGHAGHRLRHGLVVAEIALSVLLLLGAGLLARTVLNLQRVEPGFDSHDVLTMRLTLPPERYDGEAANAFFEALLERLQAIPGVTSASAASQFPPFGAFDTQFRLDGDRAADAMLPTALVTVATPAYFETLAVPLRNGRTFTPGDRLDSTPVAIVNRAFASRYLPGTDPLGRRVALGSPDQRRPWTTIVGVVADFRNSGAALPIRPEIYVPVNQQTAWNQLFLLLRAGTGAGAASLVPSVRQAVVGLDPEQPIYAVQTLEDAVATSAFQQRTSATLLGTFAALALVLAAIGIYGVMSYTVSARTQEIGVRLAIGAQRRDVVLLVLRQVGRLTGAGVALGTGALLVAGPILERLLFGVTPADPLTILVVAAGLGAVALLAAWVPAARASRVDPVEALRYE